MTFHTFETEKSTPLTIQDLLALAHDRIQSYIEDDDGDLEALNSAQWFIEIVSQRLSAETGQDPWKETT